MLTDLSIKNIAIIDSLHITLKAGLTVLTGETGAGKSIIIDAVGLIMGGRASAELIRSGEEEAVVEALFDISAMPHITNKLNEAGFECDGELLIKRYISRSGKNRIFINGGMATLNLLTEITPNLINIYGQHDSQILLKPENHLRLLDAYAGLSATREQFGATFQQVSSLRTAITNIDNAEKESARRVDLLGYQCDEIRRAELRIGEEEELEEKRILLANAEKLACGSGEAFERLYGGDGALLGQLRRIATGMTDLASIDHTLADTAASIESSYLQLEDAAMTLRDYASRIEADPATLLKIDDRLDLIGQLKKKYAPDVASILEYLAEIENELATLTGGRQSREQLEKDLEELVTVMNRLGSDLSQSRIKAAAKLKVALESEIHQLAMKGAAIEPFIEALPEPRSNGFEKVEFMFSPNQGETARPLAKIASGGELSRLMLAIKQVLPDSEVPTLVFDEVDTGIGGATSELVGRKLHNVAGHQQVLCITHLPQVAVFSSQQLRVEKHLNDNRTSTRVRELDHAERVNEIARMIAGATIGESALKHAEEMLRAAGN